MVYLILVLNRFNDYIIQDEYTLINNLSLSEVSNLLVAVLILNYLGSIVLGFRGPKIHCLDALLVLPHYKDALTLITKISLFVSKYQAHINLFTMYENKEKHQKEILKAIRLLKEIQTTIEESESRETNIKVVSALTQELCFSLCSCLIIARQVIQSVIILTFIF